MSIKTIDQVDVASKTVLIRVDYNVPYDENMHITDDTRLFSTFPTIEYCLKRGAKILLISHMGRPKGKVVPSMSLRPIAAHLSELLKQNVEFLSLPIGGSELLEKVKTMKAGDIYLLENIRFYPGEESNDDEFGKQLAALADVFINDAFAAAHNDHCSNHAITQFMDVCAAGFLLRDEIEFFKKAMTSADHPICAIVGGAKVSSKLDALYNIINRVDFIIIGGGMAFTFLKALGYNVGKSILEENLVDTAKIIMENAKKNNVTILLPTDILTVKEFKNDAPSEIVKVSEIKDDQIGVDIGPDTIALFTEKIKEAKSVIWNGPMGAFEMPNFANGTNAVTKALAASSCLSLVGGGDSVAAVNQIGLQDKVSYLSTGGGAFLKLLEGKILPAIEALDKY